VSETKRPCRNGSEKIGRAFKKARLLKADIVFIDESGFLMAPLVRRTWAPRGKTPILLHRGRWHKKVSAIAALTVPAHRKRVGLYFSLLSNANFTAGRVVQFLRNLRVQLQKPLIVVCDRSMTHRAKIVNKFLKRNSKIHREFLPPYAPDINPVEMLWGHLKGNPLANFAPVDEKALASTTRYHATRLKGRKDLLRSFLYATPLFSRPK
jgi:transposase